MKLDGVGFADNSPFEGADGDGIFGADAVALFVRRGVHSVVLNSSLSGEYVFGPLLLNVDECALAGTKDIVLEGGEWKKIVVGVHGVADDEK